MYLLLHVVVAATAFMMIRVFILVVGLIDEIDNDDETNG
jgi:hypothetical protein